MPTIKRSRLRGSRRAVWLVIAATLMTSPAYAYLDPGTGSIILQGLLAGIAVAAGFVRMYWQRFKSLFTREPAQVNSADDAAPPEESEASS